MKPSVLLKTTFLLALAATLSAGCKRTKPGAGAEFDGEQINPGDELSWSGDMPLAGGSFQDPSLYEPVATPAGVYPVFFRYNESAIPAGELSKVDAVAALLLQSPQLVVLVEGNCDERGTNEYNMSLGEFRAQSIRNALVAQGIEPARIQTVSYGEEKPAVPGSGESAWRLNRRGDFAFFQR